MKIGFDARLYGPFHRGIGKYTELLLGELYKKCPDDLVIFGDQSLQATFPRARVVPVSFRAYSIAEQMFFGKILKQENCDIYYFPHFNVPFLFSRPFVVTIHDLIIHEFPNERATTLPAVIYRIKLLLYFFVLRRVIKRAKKIIAVSNTTQGVILKYYPEVRSKIQVVYEGPTLIDKFEKKVDISGKYFLYVGAAYPHKNLERLLQSFIEVADSDTKLVLVGRKDFFYNRLESEFGKNINVIFYGGVDSETLASLYMNAIVYISPGLQEGFNLNALDALVFNKPVIVSDIEVNHEIIGAYGNYFNPLDKASLCRLLRNFLENNEKMDEILAKNILSKFSWEKTASDILKILSEA